MKNYGMILFVALVLGANAQDFEQIKTAFQRSYTAETNKKYGDAIKAIQSIESADCYECKLRLGWLYHLQGKYTESYGNYKAAFLLRPASTEALWAAVNPLTKAENWAELSNVYQKILGNDPKNSVANYRLGLSYYYKKDYVRALKYLQVALDLHPFDYETMLTAGWTHYFLGNKNEAKILFRKVLVYSPSDTSALEGLSLIK